MFRKKLLLITFGVAVSLVIAELSIRIYPSGLPPDALELSKKSLQFEPAVLARFRFSSVFQDIHTDTAAGATNLKVNAQGFRGPAVTDKKATGTKRIVFIGGSSTFDVTASDGKDWPHLVENTLNTKESSRFEVINAGVPGYAAIDALGRLLGELHEYEPDFVALYSGWNDLKLLTLNDPIYRSLKPMDHASNKFRYPQGFIDRSLLRFSKLYGVLRSIYLLNERNIGLEGDITEAWSPKQPIDRCYTQYELNLQTIVDVIRSINATPLIITEAHLVSTSNSPEERSRIRYDFVQMNHDTLVEAYRKIESIEAKVARDKNVQLIDAASQLSGKAEFFFDHVHTTPRGSEELSKIVAAKINAAIH